MNQIADIEVDRKNGGVPLVASGIVSIPSATVMIILFSLLSLILPVLFHSPVVALAAAVTLVTGYVYSFKPFRFSGRPFADFLSNAFGYGIIAFGVGWTVAGKTLISTSFLLSALPYFFLMAGGSISSTLPDRNGDRADGKNTTAVVLGVIKAHTLALSLLIVGLIAGWCRHDLFAEVCTAVSLPFYFMFYWKKERFFMEATYKIGGTLCMVAAFAALPLFIPLAIVVFIATWLYFRIRHGISYPSLVPRESNP